MLQQSKKEVYWFHEQIHVEEYPWAFKNGDPKRRIAALEMLGTLFLCNMILTHQGPLSSRVRLPVGSDNQGNVMAMLWIQEALHGGDPDGVGLPAPHPWLLADDHVPREFNQWADELTHPDFSGGSTLCKGSPSRNSVRSLFFSRVSSMEMHLISAWAHPCSRDRSGG